MSTRSLYFLKVRERLVWEDGVERETVIYYNSLFLRNLGVIELLKGRSGSPTLQTQPETSDPGLAPTARCDRERVMSKFYLSDLSEKDKPWDIHRFQSDCVRNLYRVIDRYDYAERIQHCSQRLLFSVTHEDGRQRFRLQFARFCRVRHCPVCQWRRALSWVARFYRALPIILGDYPTAKFILLTLTIRNCPTTDLRVTLARMNRAFRRLTFRKDWPALGYVRSFEVTPALAPHDRSSSSSPNRVYTWCHPHFHALLMVPSGYFSGHSYLSHDRWVKLWRECLQVNYDPIVDVRRVGRNKEDPQELIKAVKETLKYAVKPDHLLDPIFLKEITQQLHKTRSISLGGLIRKYISDSEPEDSELVSGEGLDDSGTTDSEWFFDWQEPDKRYAGRPID